MHRIETCMIVGVGWAAVLCSAPLLLAYTNFQDAEIVMGQPDMTSQLVNQGGAVSAQTLNRPTSVVQIDGKLLVADRFNNRVLIFNQVPSVNNAMADLVIGQPDMGQNSANQNTTPTARTLSQPVCVATDGVKLFIADIGNSRVLIYNSVPTANHAAADVVIGQPDMSSNLPNQGGPPNANTLYNPHDVHTDGQRLWVADFWNHRVLIFNTIPTASHASADVVVGQPDMLSNSHNQGGDVGNAEAYTLYHPSSVHAANGKLFIVDFWNCRVLLFNALPTLNNASADIVIGQPDMTSETENQGTTPAAYTLGYPESIGIHQGRVFIADDTNSRVLIYNQIPTANNASADVVIGQPDMASRESRPAAANTLSSPFSPAVYGLQLFVPDAGNNRILIFADITPTPTPVPSAAGFLQVLRSLARVSQGEAIALRVQLSTPGQCTIMAYDITGRKAAKILDESVTGTKEIVWPAHGLASGTYLIQAEAGHAKARAKVVVVR